MAAPLLFVVFFSACTKDRPSDFQAQAPLYFPEPHYKSHLKEYTTGRFELGKKLFFDPILSTDHSISCASCHSKNMVLQTTMCVSAAAFTVEKEFATHQASLT